MLTPPWIIGITTGGIFVVLAIFSRMWYNRGYQQHVNWERASMATREALILRNEKPKWIAEGEKTGFARGFEAGQAESKTEFREEFVEFLQNQIRILRHENLP